MKQPPKQPKTSAQVTKLMKDGRAIDAAVRRAIKQAIKPATRA